VLRMMIVTWNRLVLIRHHFRHYQCIIIVH
jgi:hypothetical protein